MSTIVEHGMLARQAAHAVTGQDDDSARLAPGERNADWFAALGYGVPVCIGAMALAAVAGLPAHVLGVAWFGVGLCVMSIIGYLSSAR